MTDTLLTDLSKQKLGEPLPNSPHAVSVSLPKWDDVIGYEEKEPRVINALKSGYPRFVYQPAVQKLFKSCEEKFAKEGEFCLAFPSASSAKKCIEFVGTEGTINPYGQQGVYVVSLPNDSKESAKTFWQHSGFVISTRQAESLLKDEKHPPANEEKQKIKKHIAKLANNNENDVYLFASGMTGIYTAYQSLLDLFPGRRTIQLGFPYVDTIKIQEKFGNGVHFVKYDSEEDLKTVEEIIKIEPIAALFCEFPGNPLLQSIDLEALSKLLRAHNIPLVIDDTIATWSNIDLTPYADLIATSLTKFFSGTGDVLAGSIVINNKSPFYEGLKEAFDNNYEDLLFSEDAKTLEENSRDFSNRIKKINNTTEELCDYLKDHPAIENIYYPKYITSDVYNRLKKPEGGYGGLFSITLKDEEKAPDFYNKLEIAKGPSLGTNFTLACPYTLMAHYNELDFAKKFGVSSNLVRVSVGLEDPEELIECFKRALNSN